MATAPDAAAAAAAAEEEVVLVLFSIPLGHGGMAAEGMAGGGQHPRPGEWACTCGFTTNRAARIACFVCKKPREQATINSNGLAGPRHRGPSAAEVGGWGGSTARGAHARHQPRAAQHAGPIGANGSRPLLSCSWTARREAAASQEPSYRVPGASLAAAAKSARTVAASQPMRTQAVGPHRNSVAGHGLGGGAATRGQNFNRFSPLANDTEVDGTPFQPVQGGHRGGANRDAGAPAAGTAGGSGGNHHGRQGGEGEESRDVGDDDPEEYEDYDDDQVTGTCDPSVLHAEWTRQRKAVQCMERNGLYDDGEEVLERARRARGDAEQASRDAKNP